MRLEHFLTFICFLLLPVLVLAQEAKKLGEVHLSKANYPLSHHLTIKAGDEIFVFYEKDEKGACYLIGYDFVLKQLWKNRLKNNDTFFPDLFYHEKRKKLIFFQNLGFADNYGCFVQEHDPVSGKRLHTVQLLVGQEKTFKAVASPNQQYFLLTNLHEKDKAGECKAIVYNLNWEVYNEQFLDPKTVAEVAVNNEGEVLVLKKTINNQVLLEGLYARKMEELMNYQPELGEGEQIDLGNIYQQEGNYYVPLIKSDNKGISTEILMLSFDVKQLKMNILNAGVLTSKQIKKFNKVRLTENETSKVEALQNLNSKELIFDEEGRFFLISEELIIKTEKKGKNYKRGNILVCALDKNGNLQWNTIIESEVQFNEQSHTIKKGTEAVSSGFMSEEGELKFLVPANVKTEQKEFKTLFLGFLDKKSGNLKSKKQLFPMGEDSLVPSTGRLWLGSGNLLVARAILNNNSTMVLQVLNCNNK